MPSKSRFATRPNRLSRTGYSAANPPMMARRCRTGSANRIPPNGCSRTKSIAKGRPKSFSKGAFSRADSTRCTPRSRCRPGTLARPTLCFRLSAWRLRTCLPGSVLSFYTDRAQTKIEIGTLAFTSSVSLGSKGEANSRSV